MRYRVAGHAVDLGGGVYLLETISLAQGAGGDLSRGRLLSRAGGGEGEDAAGTHAQDAADDPLLPHAQTDHGMLFAFPFEKLHHDYVVVERASGAYHLVIVGREGGHFLERLLQLAGGAEIMERENDGSGGAQAV